MSDALLRASGLVHAFGASRVLDGVDLRLEPGELRVVAGPNGSGKTTLVRVLAGVLEPRAGEVWLGADPLRALARRRVAQRVAVVPQESYVPFPFSVREMVGMGRAPWLGPLGREGPQDVAVVSRILEEQGLTALEARSFTTLSGGEKQRVLLARARPGSPAALARRADRAHGSRPSAAYL